MKQSSRYSLWMVAASFLFACMGVCVKLAAEQHSAAEIVFWRSAISLAIMVAVMRRQGLDFRTQSVGLQLVRGFCGFISLALFFVAIVLLPLATAVTLNYTSAIFLALFLALTGLRLRGGMMAALVVGLLGVGLLLQPTFHADQLVGGLVGLASGVVAGLAYFNVRELAARGEHEMRTVFYFSLVSTVCASIWLAFSEIHAVDLKNGLLLFGTASFATLAQLAMTRAYTRGKTLLSAALAYSTVIFSSLFGMLFWDETHDASAWLAIALIILSGVGATHFSRTTKA
jgi:S-adenosylmethionine uptake transporter